MPSGSSGSSALEISSPCRARALRYPEKCLQPPHVDRLKPVVCTADTAPSVMTGAWEPKGNPLESDNATVTISRWKESHEILNVSLFVCCY